MNIQSSFFIISVMILALIVSPITFSGSAFAQKESDIGDSVEIFDSIEIQLNPDENAEDTDNEIEIEVEIEDGIAKIEAEFGDEKLEFEIEWVDEQTTIAEIAIRTGLSIDEIEGSITFEIHDEEREDDAEDASEEDTDVTINQSTISNLGQEVSNFVKESRALFEQQKVETKAVIQDCRSSMIDTLPSERQDVRQECKDNLKDIRDSYKDLRETYHETFKQFRENMKILIKESKGLEINQEEKAAALANIESLSQNEDKREKIKELQQKMREEIKEEKKQLREQMKKEREISREAMKEQRETEREAMNEQRETEREAMNEQRETEREAMNEQRETEREAMKEQRETERDTEEAAEETEES